MKLRSQIVILCGIGALLMSFDLEASKAGNEIFYVKEHLTAHLVEANLKEVLSSVAKEAKVAFSLNEAIGAKSSLRAGVALMNVIGRELGFC